MIWDKNSGKQNNAEAKALVLYLCVDIFHAEALFQDIVPIFDFYKELGESFGFKTDVCVEFKNLFKKRFYANGGKNRVREYGHLVKSSIAHLPYLGLSFGCREECVRTATFDWLRECVDAANQCGIFQFVAHMNFDFDTDRPPRWLRNAVEWWKLFLEATDERNLFYLENMLEPTTAPFKAFFDSLNSTRVKMCLDIGHLNCTGQDYRLWLAELGKYIGHYHLSDNFGYVRGTPFHERDKHLCVGVGSIEWTDFLPAAMSCAPLASFCFEVMQKDIDASVRHFLTMLGG